MTFMVVLSCTWAAAQQPTFRLTTEAVRVEASVRRSNRTPYTGLTIADFEVLDNGVPQELVDVTFGKMPIDVTVALDVSYSVNGAMLDRLRRAMAQLVRDLGADDRLRLLLFHSNITRAVGFTRDVSAVDRALATVKAGGGTTVFDTLSVALVSASDPDRRQLVVVFTDGGDSNSTTDAEELIDVARRTTATIAFVMPPAVMVRSAPAPSLRDRLYASLVSETGGSRIDVGPSTDLTAAFRRVLDDFRSAYVLYFRPKGVDATGFHSLAVSVKKPAANVLARRGYFGG